VDYAITRWRCHPGQAVAAALKARIGTLEAELAKFEAAAAVHRADFERERERAADGRGSQVDGGLGSGDVGTVPPPSCTAARRRRMRPSAKAGCLSRSSRLAALSLACRAKGLAFFAMQALRGGLGRARL